MPDTAPLDPRFSACPFLPDAPAAMDWRALHALRDERGGAFYLRCLEYGQHLWLRGLAARAILAVDRGLLTELTGDEPELVKFPQVYEALAWMIAHTPADVFIGNPRVHYQHLADRVREPRREQRRWRSWACWHLARIVWPDLEADPRHVVDEPAVTGIAQALDTHGMPGERDRWQHACTMALSFAARTPGLPARLP